MISGYVDINVIREEFSFWNISGNLKSDFMIHVTHKLILDLRTFENLRRDTLCIKIKHGLDY